MSGMKAKSSMNSENFSDGSKKIVYLHIGPHKTGTTSLQNALLRENARLKALGVEYIVTGGRGNANFSARAIRNKPTQKLDSAVAVPRRYWTDIVRAARSSTATVCIISGEGFADCDNDEIALIAHELAPGQLRIVLTLRPIAKILPSQWQQYVQNAMMTGSFDDWLSESLDRFDRMNSIVDPEGFWRRHRHDQLVARWKQADAYGTPIVVVADESKPTEIMNAFERLLGIPLGTLVSGSNLVNRSLTLPEIELVRAYYNLLHTQGFESRVFRRGISVRPALYLKEKRTPTANEMKVQIPTSMVERVRSVADQIVDGLARQQIEIQGNLEHLRVVQSSAHVKDKPDHLVSPELAAYLTVGMLAKLGAVRPRGKILSSKWTPLRDYSRRIAQYVPGGPAILGIAKRLIKRILP
jgi:hypothetical protein